MPSCPVGRTMACQSHVGTLGLPTKAGLGPGLHSKGAHSAPGGREESPRWDVRVFLTLGRGMELNSHRGSGSLAMIAFVNKRGRLSAFPFCELTSWFPLPGLVPGLNKMLSMKHLQLGIPFSSRGSPRPLPGPGKSLPSSGKLRPWGVPGEPGKGLASASSRFSAMAGRGTSPTTFSFISPHRRSSSSTESEFPQDRCVALWAVSRRTLSERCCSGQSGLHKLGNELLRSVRTPSPPSLFALLCILQTLSCPRPSVLLQSCDPCVLISSLSPFHSCSL